MKNKADWPEIIEIGKKENLNNEQILILLSLLENDREEGYELHKLEAKGKDILGKAQVYAKWLRNKEYHYQNYLKRSTDPNQVYSFIEYVVDNTKDDILKCMEEIENELFKEST